jgi:16S rRNA (cytidine1402-2'-O)-methyltransferase
LNDPGYELVRAVISAGFSVSPIPGACAPIAALVASGLPTDAFLYLGYLPRKQSERSKAIEQVVNLPYTLVFLEAPHRLLDSLVDLQGILGDRQVAISRELTKLHEEIFRGSLGESRQHFTENPPRGEFTLVLAGAAEHVTRWAEEQVSAALQAGLAAKESASHLSARLAGLSGWSRGEIYNFMLELQGKRGPRKG